MIGCCFFFVFPTPQPAWTLSCVPRAVLLSCPVPPSSARLSPVQSSPVRSSSVQLSSALVLVLLLLILSTRSVMYKRERERDRETGDVMVVLCGWVSE